MKRVIIWIIIVSIFMIYDKRDVIYSVFHPGYRSEYAQSLPPYPGPKSTQNGTHEK